jgi:hypothetical protein
MSLRTLFSVTCLSFAIANTLPFTNALAGNFLISNDNSVWAVTSAGRFVDTGRIAGSGYQMGNLPHYISKKIATPSTY